MQEETKWYLSAEKAPDAWLNLASLFEADYPRPVLGEENRPLTVCTLAAKYVEECARIELLDGEYASQRHISIPGPVVEGYSRYRPTPLFRARQFERRLDYEGRIFFKREDGNPTGSHKPNTAIPQAYYAAQQGLAGLVTDTGAGQWGTALALACRDFGLSCTVFMTRNSYEDKPHRRYLMQLAGARVASSPSELTSCGRTLYAQDHSHPGSLGIGMSEAMEKVETDPALRLSLGCMSYYAALHQTVVGQELALQLKAADCQPDLLIGCVGGGTNLWGFLSPFLLDRLEDRSAPEMIAAESANVPALTQGQYRYDYADFFGLTPRILMYTLGHEFIPPRIHSGGLRYHGKSPVLSLMVRRGWIRPTAISQEDAFAAGRHFFESEGVLPAPESNHAIAAVVEQVNKAKSEGLRKEIVFCLSGTGYLDLTGYARQFNLS